MKHLSNSALAALSLACALQASAATQIPADRTITSIGAYATSGWVAFSPAIPNLEGCPYAAGDVVYFDWSSDPNAKMMYSTALAAYLAGHKVGFGVAGCLPGSAALAYRIDVKP